MAKISSYETELLPLGWECRVTFDDGDCAIFRLLDNGVRLVCRQGFVTREEFILGLEMARKQILQGQILAEFDQKRANDEVEALTELKRVGWDDDYRP